VVLSLVLWGDGKMYVGIFNSAVRFMAYTVPFRDEEKI